MRVGAIPIAVSVVAVAGGDDDDAGGSEDTTARDVTEAEAKEPAVEGKTEITVTGPERDESEAGSIQAAFDVWGDANGVAVTYIGDADWEANVNTQVEGGNPPDISFFPQPGKLAGFARALSRPLSL